MHLTNIIDATQRVVPGYFERCLGQRSRGNALAAGSVYDLSTEALESALRQADWTEMTHPAVAPGCKAYAAYIPEGHYGMINLARLDDEETVRLIDPKATGFVTPALEGADLTDRNLTSMPFTWAIVGQEQGEDVLFTFHPGEPLEPSKLEATPGMLNAVVTVAEARQLGFQYAKLV